MVAKKVADKKGAKKRGPKPGMVQIEGDWKDAVKHALTRGNPPKPKRG